MTPVRRAAHPRRAAEARIRGRSVDGRQVHGEEGAREVTDLENLPSQSCGRHRRHGRPGRADGRLQVPLRFGHSQAPTPPPDISQRDGNPTAEWIARQITDAFPWNEAPEYLIHERDPSYGHAVTMRLSAMGMRDHCRIQFSPGRAGRRVPPISPQDFATNANPEQGVPVARRYKACL